MIRGYLASRFPRGGFARNVGVLAGSTAFAQGLMVLALPFLTRFYSPEDFSVLAVYMAVLSLLTIVSCMRYNVAIPLPSDERDAMSLLYLSGLIALVVALLVTSVVVLAPQAVATLIGAPELQAYLWMVPLGAFLASGYAALEFLASRRKKFSLVAKTRVVRALGGTGIQMGFGLFHVSPFGLLLGHMIYGGLGALGLLVALVTGDRHTARDTSWERVKANARIYADYPRYSVPEAFFNAAGTQVPVLLIAAYALGPEAGFVMLAMRIMEAPLGLIGRSVSQVFISEAPAKHRNGELAHFTKQTMRNLLIIGGGPMLLGGVLAPFLVPVIFGAEWSRAGLFILWFTPWFLMQFMVSPVSMVLHVVGRVSLAMKLQFFGALMRIAPVLLMSIHAAESVVPVYALFSAMFYAVYGILLLKLVDEHPRYVSKA